MDSIQLLSMIKGMRDDRKFQCGEEIKKAEPRLLLGCAANPFADPFEFRAPRLGKKVKAGANFVQTQIIYNVEKFAKFMEMVRDLGIHENCYILAGVTPPKSLGMARYMKKFVPGMDVTDEVIDRLAAADDQKEEGINICVDIIKQVQDIPGVAGVHIMAIEWEEAVPEIVKRAGLDQRPEPKGIEPMLISSAAIDEAVENARGAARKEAEKELDKVRAEAQASRELVVKEKEKVASEISGLKKQVEEAKGMADQKEAEVRKLTEEINRIKNELQQAPSAAAPRHAEGAAAAPVPPPPAGGPPVLTPREQHALNSLNLGLMALRKALGLDEDQFEALRRFLEAEFLLQLGQAGAVPAPAQAPVPPASAPEAAPAAPAAPESAPEAAPEAGAEPEPQRSKEVVNLVAKGNMLLHKNDAAGAVEAFTQALAIDPDDEKAREGLSKAEAAAPAPEAPAAETGECPEGLEPEEWRFKQVVRYTAKGNVCLMKNDASGAIEMFKKALELDPENEKAKDGLRRAEAGEGVFIPEVESGGAALAAEKPAEEKPAEAAPEEKEAEKPVEEEKKAEPAPEPEKAAEPEAEKEARPVPEPAVSAPAAPAGEGVSSVETAPLAREEAALSERAGDIPEDMYMEPCAGAIQECVIGDGDSAITLGGEKTLPFHTFEGEMGNAPKIAFEVLDSAPDEWPEPLVKYYSDVFNDPAAWAQKCVREFNAQSICLSLVSTDPNGANVSSADAAKVAQKVVESVDVPIVLWGCGNAEKDTETLREITGLTGTRKICIGPLSDANYRTLGATAMAFQYPVVASTPIDVNLAKQLNILLENLGVSLDHILMDPSIGAVGYGLEYTYSVMERIRLAALTQNDDKLSVPFIVNLGREVWKAKETKQPSDGMLGDQERRGVLMEAITASSLLFAGGELMVMRHPKAVSMTEALIEGLM